MQTKFVFNGKEYNSIEEMPAEVRQQYERLIGALDKDRNGIPDFVESGGFLGKAAFKVIAKTIASKGGVDLSTLPPELRKMLDAGADAASSPQERSEQQLIVETHSAQQRTSAPGEQRPGGLEGLTFTKFLYILLAIAIGWLIYSQVIATP